jgi:hypothetical protein
MNWFVGCSVAVADAVGVGASTDVGVVAPRSIVGVCCRVLDLAGGKLALDTPDAPNLPSRVSLAKPIAIKYTSMRIKAALIMHTPAMMYPASILDLLNSLPEASDAPQRGQPMFLPCCASGKCLSSIRADKSGLSASLTI